MPLVVALYPPHQPELRSALGSPAHQLAGQLRPRERLVEDGIIARTDATRHAVRRAFDELERMGLVIRQPNKGVQVSDYSIREIEELYEIRECLERQAASRFNEPADTALVKELTDIASRHRDASRAQHFAKCSR